MTSAERRGKVTRMTRGENGVTTVEYAIIIALGLIFVLGGLELLGDGLALVFNAQREQIEN